MKSRADLQNSEKREEGIIEDSICPIHNKKYEYICTECKQKLCPDCLFEEYTSEQKKHEGHKIKKYVNQTIAAKNALKTEIKKAEQLIAKISGFIDNQDVYSKDLASQLYETKIEMSKSLKAFKKSLDSQYTQLEQNLLNEGYSLSSTISVINKILSEAESIIMTNDLNILPSAREFLKRLNDFVSKEPDFDIPPVQLSKPTGLIPPFVTRCFELENYNQICEKMKKMPEPGFIYLPEFKEFGAKWRIKVYPCGSNKGAGTHIALFLEVLKGMDNKNQFYYQVDLYNNNTGAFYERHYVSDFVNLDSWGWNRYFPIQSIKDGNFLDPVTNKLTIKVSIKPTTYIVYTKICNNILEKKEAKYNKLKDLAIERGIKEKKDIYASDFPPLECTIVDPSEDDLF